VIILAGIAGEARMALLAHLHAVVCVPRTGIVAGRAAGGAEVSDPAGLIVLAEVIFQVGLCLPAHLDPVQCVASTSVVTRCARCSPKIGQATAVIPSTGILTGEASRSIKVRYTAQPVVAAGIAIQGGLRLTAHPNTMAAIIDAQILARRAGCVSAIGKSYAGVALTGVLFEQRLRVIAHLDTGDGVAQARILARRASSIAKVYQSGSGVMLAQIVF
jgi:hypothetical protein